MTAASFPVKRMGRHHQFDAAERRAASCLNPKPIPAVRLAQAFCLSQPGRGRTR